MRIKTVIISIFLSFHFITAFTQNDLNNLVFTERELEIIYSGDESKPLRILQTNDIVDSVILRMQSTDICITDSVFLDESMQLFIKRLRVTLNESGGVGIAAPQTGILKNIFLFTKIDMPGKNVQIAINPKIANHAAEKVCFEQDGCLSIPDITANSLRFPWIEVEYFDEEGNYRKERLEGYSRDGDFTAIIFQHEFDHLMGILFIDKICKK